MEDTGPPHTSCVVTGRPSGIRSRARSSAAASDGPGGVLEVDDVDEHHLRALRHVVQDVQQVQPAPLADRHARRRTPAPRPSGRARRRRGRALPRRFVLGHDGLRCCGVGAGSTRPAAGRRAREGRRALDLMAGRHHDTWACRAHPARVRTEGWTRARQAAPGGRARDAATSSSTATGTTCCRSCGSCRPGSSCWPGSWSPCPSRRASRDLDDLPAHALPRASSSSPGVTTLTMLVPIAVHRRLFGEGVKEWLVATAHPVSQVLLGAVALLIVGVTSLVFDVVVGRTAGPGRGRRGAHGRRGPPGGAARPSSRRRSEPSEQDPVDRHPGAGFAGIGATPGRVCL